MIGGTTNRMRLIKRAGKLGAAGRMVEFLGFGKEMT